MTDGRTSTQHDVQTFSTSTGKGTPVILGPALVDLYLGEMEKLGEKLVAIKAVAWDPGLLSIGAYRARGPARAPSKLGLGSRTNGPSRA